MVIAFLLAAGQSRRFGSDKLFASMGKRTVFKHALDFLEKAPEVSWIFIAANKKNIKKIKQIVDGDKHTKVVDVFLGGRTRFESVKLCLAAYQRSAFRVPRSAFIIHNAANPFATQEELIACFKKLKGRISGVAVGRPVSSTLKYAPCGRVEKTISRRDLWELETPQVVRAKDFLKACEKVTKLGLPEQDFTDDLSVLEAAGFQTCVIPASPRNRKITTPEDLEVMRTAAGGISGLSAVGIGEDSHGWRISKDKNVKNFQSAQDLNVRSGRKNLVLGGVQIPGFSALEAKSDGDVVLHALCNALASSRGRGSLGTYANGMCRRGIGDSREYLKKNLQELRRAHRRVKHCSFSIEAGRPKIDPLVPALKKSLSSLLSIPESRIGITVTSGEKLTPFGKGQAIQCRAIVLLQSVRSRR